MRRDSVARKVVTTWLFLPPLRPTFFTHLKWFLSFRPHAFPPCPALPFLSFRSPAFSLLVLILDPLYIFTILPSIIFFSLQTALSSLIEPWPTRQRFNPRQANMCYILDIAKYWVEIIAHMLMISCSFLEIVNSMKFSLVREKKIYIPDLWICEVDRQEICWRTSQTGMWTSGSYYSMMVGVLSWHDSNLFLSFSHSYLKLYLLHEFTGTIFSYIEGRNDWETIW